MGKSILAAAAVIVGLNAPALAQTYTTMPMLGGGYYTTGPSGSYTTMPTLGGSSYTTGPNGYSATTMPTFGGGSYTTVNPGYSYPSSGLYRNGYR